MSIRYSHDVLNLTEITSNERNKLEFKTANDLQFSLGAFDSHHFEDEMNQFSVINLVKPVTAMDWCPSVYERESPDEIQYLAVATDPLDQVIQQFASSATLSGTNPTALIKLYRSPNLVHFLKMSNISSLSCKNNSHFAILNRDIGVISVIKWRPDFGASRSRLGNGFLGYLLVAGSNGNGYVYIVEDLTLSPNFISNTNGMFAITVILFFFSIN